MKEITIRGKNEVGILAAIAESLGNIGVNIEAISAHESNNQAILRLVTSDVATTKKALARLPNITVSDSDILVVKLHNKPGELGKLTRKLADQGVNLESVYIVSRSLDFTEVAVKPAPQDYVKVQQLLGVK
jgi:hypothetical protein